MNWDTDDRTARVRQVAAHVRAVQDGTYQGVTPGRLVRMVAEAAAAPRAILRWSFTAPGNHSGILIYAGGLWSARWAESPDAVVSGERGPVEMCAWLNYQAAQIGTRLA